MDGLTAIDMKNLAVVFKALGGAFAVRHSNWHQSAPHQSAPHKRMDPRNSLAQCHVWPGLATVSIASVTTPGTGLARRIRTATMRDRSLPSPSSASSFRSGIRPRRRPAIIHVVVAGRGWCIPSANTYGPNGCHICVGTGPIPSTPAPRLGHPEPSGLGPADICTAMVLGPATSTPGRGSSLPHLRRD